MDGHSVVDAQRHMGPSTPMPGELAPVQYQNSPSPHVTGHDGTPAGTPGGQDRRQHRDHPQALQGALAGGWNRTGSPPHTSSAVSQLEGRQDTRGKVNKPLPVNSLQVFTEQSLPVVEHYEALSKVARIDAHRDPEEVYREVRRLFEEL